MTYRNHEGYPDPTSGRAINGVRWEELPRLREKEHNLKRGQQITLYVKCQSEEASSHGRAKNYTDIVCFWRMRKAIEQHLLTYSCSH